MKRRGADRVLTFAVTGALLGGVGAGCHHQSPGPTVNPGPSDEGAPVDDDAEAPPDDAEAPADVNEGPVDEPEGPIVNTQPTK